MSFLFINFIFLCASYARDPKILPGNPFGRMSWRLSGPGEPARVFRKERFRGRKGGESRPIEWFDAL